MKSIRYIILNLLILTSSCIVSKDIVGKYEYKGERAYHSLELLNNSQFIFKELDGVGAGLNTSSGQWKLEDETLYLKGDRVNNWFVYVETEKINKLYDELEIKGFFPSSDDERIVMAVNGAIQEMPKIDTVIIISKANNIKFYNKIDNSVINKKIITDNEQHRFRIEVVPELGGFYFGEKKYVIKGNKLKSEGGLIYKKQ